MKNKKSFPELGDAVFRPAFGSQKSPAFRLPEAFWAAVDQDPVLKAEMNRRVEESARKLLQQEFAPERAKLFEEARTQGFDQGLGEAKAQLAVVATALSEAATTVLGTKQQLLYAHERVWAQTLVHLCKRFFVPVTAERLQAVRDWVQGAVQGFREQGRLQVAVPSELFRQIQLVKESMEVPGVEWIEDPALSQGALRVSLGSGHILFDPETEWRKLEAFLEQEFALNHEVTG